MSSNPFAEKAAGQFPLSIATSLAFESLVNIHPEIKHRVDPINNIQNLWINLRTLQRNIIGAMRDGVTGPSSTGDFVEELFYEIETIEDILKDYNSKVNLVIYFSEYEGLERKYRDVGLIRRDTTDKQKFLTAFNAKVFQMALKDERAREFQIFKNKITPPTTVRGKTYIITHYAYDLCSKKEFEHLSLLETHTGVIKEYSQWYTKYLDGKNLSTIPFREDLLQVFGDKETFHPQNKKWREMILEVSRKYNWNPLTTRERIKYGIETIKDPLVKKLILSILV